MNPINRFYERFPDGKSILSVYAFMVTLIYSWTLFTSFYKLPSWLFYLTIDQMLIVYAYEFSVNFLESLIALATSFVFHYTIFLPFENKYEFQARSIIWMAVLLGTSMYRLVLFQNYEDIDLFLKDEILWWSAAILIGLFFAILLPKIETIRNAIEEFAKRTIVLLYIYIPISIVSLVVVIVRNIN